ncbi:hypothetical protein WJX77_011847 [Trebouxia sp. C0004]
MQLNEGEEKKDVRFSAVITGAFPRRQPGAMTYALEDVALSQCPESHHLHTVGSVCPWLLVPQVGLKTMYYGTDPTLYDAAIHPQSMLRVCATADGSVTKPLGTFLSASMNP